MADGSVTIRIDGDASGYEKELKSVGAKTKAGLADIKAGIDMAAAAAKSLFSVMSSGVSYNASIEQLQTSFEVMTGSAQKAEEVVNRLRTMGAETPFEMIDLANTTQLLMQYGFTADDALDKMRMLGDIAQGNKEAMTSIAMGYAQMSSAGKVNLQDIKQMINGGFNPLQEISERTGESMESLYDRISDGEMSIDEITESMQYATSEGGKFFASMEKQSETLSGQLSTLKDNASQLMGSLSEGFTAELRTEMLPLANNIISELQSAFDKGGFEGLLDSAADMLPDLLKMMSGKLQEVVDGLQRWLPKVAKSIMKAVPGAIKGAAEALPKIVDVLFDVVGTIVEDLIAMLPELIPTLIEGLWNLAGSVLNGLTGIVESIYNGIDRAIHTGQTKIAGKWIDNSEIAKYDFDFDMDIDVSGEVSEIEQAYTQLRAALQTDLLTDEQLAEIQGMIGGDYDEIKAKLMSFGLTEEEAAGIAAPVSEAGSKILNAIAELDIGIPPETVVKWMVQANGSRMKLKQQLANMGLSDQEIKNVVDVYDTMLGKVSEQTPSIIEEIYTKLTDGKPDDEATVKALTDQISSYSGDLLAALDSAYKTQIASLDETADDYEEKKKELDAWYSSTKESIGTMNTDMTTLVDTLAGAPAEVVKAKYEEFVAMEQQLGIIEQEIAELTEKARTAAENAFQVVRSGANADEATIEQAINLKASQFKLDEQAAEDAYAAAVEELNAKLADKASGYTEEEYNADIAAKQAERDAAINAAERAYLEAMGDIFKGIAESEGVEKAFADAASKMSLAEALNAAATALIESPVGMTNTEALGPELSRMLAGYMEIPESELNAGSKAAMSQTLRDWSNQLVEEADDAIANVKSDKLHTTFMAALNEGLFSDTMLDPGSQDYPSEAEQQFATLMGLFIDEGLLEARQKATDAGETLMDAVEESMEDSEDRGITHGDYYGSGFVDALASWATAAYNAAYSLGDAADRGLKDRLGTRPTKVGQQVSDNSGGYSTNSFSDAVKQAQVIAHRVLGNLPTAVDITRSMRVNMPGLTQEIVMANEQSAMTMVLDGHEVGHVMAGYNQQGLNAYQRALALGVGK